MRKKGSRISYEKIKLVFCHCLSLSHFRKPNTEYDVNNHPHDPLFTRVALKSQDYDNVSREKVVANPISKLDFIAYPDNLSR